MRTKDIGNLEVLYVFWKYNGGRLKARFIAVMDVFYSLFTGKRGSTGYDGTSSFCSIHS